MAPLTRCNLRNSSRLLVRPAMLCKWSLLVAIGAALALAQIHLRFLTRDLEIETHKLQKERAELTNNQQQILSEVEELKDLDNLRAYAENVLGLEVCPPEQSRKAVISRASAEKWEGAYMASADAAGTERKEDLFASIGERMISWSSVSLARESESPGRPKKPRK